MHKQNRKYPHDFKGPVALSPEVIRDICEQRTIKDAQNVLAAKHGISSNRVRKIWANYYGGTTLADAKGGLKKPLPTKPVPQKDINMRHLKTERAQYQVKSPKTMAAAARQDVGAKAAPVRKVAEPPQDLELTQEALEAMDDEDAEVLAGQVEAGNNSDLVREAINALLLTNKNLSSITKKHLRLAYNHGQKNSGGKYRSETDDETSTYETDDDPSNSCAIDESSVDEMPDPPARPRRVNDRYADDDKEVYIEERGISSASNYIDGNNDIRHQPANRRHGQLDGHAKELAVDTTRYNTRAQPVFTHGRPAGATTRPVQEHNLQASRPEPQISATQHYQGQNSLQQNYSRYDDKFNPGAQQGNGIHSAGRTGPGQTISGIPWLRPRPI